MASWRSEATAEDGAATPGSSPKPASRPSCVFRARPRPSPRAAAASPRRAAAAAPLPSPSFPSPPPPPAASPAAPPPPAPRAKVHFSPPDLPQALSAFAAASAAREAAARAGELRVAAGTPSGRLPLLRALLARAAELPVRLREAVAALERRAALPQYAAAAAAARSCAVVVVGAGPAGLRCAAELLLLGARVSVLEARLEFTRRNVLHLWEWVEADLVELGVKAIDSAIFSAGGIKHCGTMQLQLALLKVALLLGADVRFGCEVSRLDGSFLARLGQPCDILVDATGARCPLFQDLGFTQRTMLRSARALGIVCHFELGNEPWETQLQEGTWSQQYCQQRFTALQARGINLQNFVYYRCLGSPAHAAAGSHYCVMTADAESLLVARALRRRDAPALLAPGNVSMGGLEAYTRAAVKEFFPRLASQPMVPNQLQIFDFSERRQSNTSALVLPASRLGGDEEARVIVTRVGDALQEPFWPEGLGINRGFLQVLDCADLVAQFMRTPRADDAVLGQLALRRELLYGCTKHISAASRLSELKPPLLARRLAYRIDPCTRYCHLPAGVDWDGSVGRLEGALARMAEQRAALEARLAAAELAARARDEERARAERREAEAVACGEALAAERRRLEEEVGRRAAAAREAAAAAREAEEAAAKAVKARTKLGAVRKAAVRALEEMSRHAEAQAALEEKAAAVDSAVARGRRELQRLKGELEAALGEEKACEQRVTGATAERDALRQQLAATERALARHCAEEKSLAGARLEEKRADVRAAAAESARISQRLAHLAGGEQERERAARMASDRAAEAYRQMEELKASNLDEVVREADALAAQEKAHSEAAVALEKRVSELNASLEQQEREVRRLVQASDKITSTRLEQLRLEAAEAQTLLSSARERLQQVVREERVADETTREAKAAVLKVRNKDPHLSIVRDEIANEIAALLSKCEMAHERISRHQLSASSSMTNLLKSSSFGTDNSQLDELSQEQSAIALPGPSPLPPSGSWAVPAAYKASNEKGHKQRAFSRTIML